MPSYAALREWIEHKAQGPGYALYKRAAAEAQQLLAAAETWDETADWLLKKVEVLEKQLVSTQLSLIAETRKPPWPPPNPAWRMPMPVFATPGDCRRFDVV
jgi:hypothetical protein